MEILSAFPTVQTLSKSPHYKLEPVIEQYVYRRILVPQGCCVKKVMPLRSVSSIDFFLGDDFETIDVKTGSLVPFERCTVRGPRTRILYHIRLRGEFISFTIKFKATGLYRLLGIPMDLFVNKSLSGSLIEKIPVDKIVRRLQFSPDLDHCVRVAEPYLLFLMERPNRIPDVIEKAAHLLEQNHQLYSISDLASSSYLSVRQFERCFIRYVGISPKTYYRIHRFLRLLRAKKNTPELKWGMLAHQFGYYDQMHFVREFKSFLKTTPSSFIPSDFAF